METKTVPVSRVIEKLDRYLEKNDRSGALRHLLYWRSEAETLCDKRAELTLNCELMGLYRKISKKDEAIFAAVRAVTLVDELDLKGSVSAGTVYVDAATVYNAFSDHERALAYFSRAKDIYEKLLSSTDPKLAALYNNYALELTALKRFGEARDYYEKALTIGKSLENGAADMAITYLNMANLAETEKGFENALDEITECLDTAKELLDGISVRDGYYAFVCEKCAGTFGYYGYVEYAEHLKKTAKEIYERA